MPTIALVTCLKHPTLVEGEQLLINPLRQLGFEVAEVPWNKREVEWESFNAIVLRATWDYHTQIQEFQKWLQTLEALTVPVFNPLSVISWNMDKRYLLDLEAQGVPLIPTTLITKENLDELSSKMMAIDARSLVVKPVYGAAAFKTRRIPAHHETLLKQTIQQVLPHSSVLVQPFMDEITSEGEYSLIFFGSAFSHAVIKRPRQGDFRTQPAYGGTEEGVRVSDEIIAQAQTILTNVHKPLLYARVDGVIVQGTFRLMELELIEPYLFFEWNTSAPTQFAQTLSHMLSVS